MINLSPNQSVYATSTPNYVTYVVEGTVYEGSLSNRGVIGQGTFRSKTRLFQAIHHTAISAVKLSNNSTTDNTDFVILFGQSGSDSVIYRGTLPPNGTAVGNENGWTIYDSNGLEILDGYTRIIVSATPPVNPSLGWLWVDIS